MNVLDQFKAMQRERFAHFAALQSLTTIPAAHLVTFAGIHRGQDVLDVACGTGVVSLTAARLGASVTGLDLTPELLEVARENSAIRGDVIDWHEGDAESLPFPDSRFDVVVSQFGHMFAPRADVVVREMLRVLKPGGTIAFSTWPPELFVARSFGLVGSYSPPPPPGIDAPPAWGEPEVVRRRLGDAVKNLRFDRNHVDFPALSPEHFYMTIERTGGPIHKLVEALQDSPDTLAAFRRAYTALASEYFVNNSVRHSFLMSRAEKI